MRRTLVVHCWSLRAVESGTPPPEIRVQESDDGQTWSDRGSGIPGGHGAGLGAVTQILVPVDRRHVRLLAERGDEEEYFRWTVEVVEESQEGDRR